ncbi:MAG: Lrp/AsnC ligand binding domain-containing protein [Armatimonadota bacterium]|nr:Lrp/AsnC ligand binding domain-containing protein [Armatimonadota bacterium]
MVTAIVLIEGERDKLPETAEALADVPGVAEVYSVAGQYDLVAIIRVKEHEELADIVTKKLLKMDGIARTNTLIAFKSYSRRDLERMWEIGLEEAGQ